MPFSNFSQPVIGSAAVLPEPHTHQICVETPSWQIKLMAHRYIQPVLLQRINKRRRHLKRLLLALCVPVCWCCCWCGCCCFQSAMVTSGFFFFTCLAKQNKQVEEDCSFHTISGSVCLYSKSATPDTRLSNAARCPAGAWWALMCHISVKGTVHPSCHVSQAWLDKQGVWKSIAMWLLWCELAPHLCKVALTLQNVSGNTHLWLHWRVCENCFQRC